MGLSSLIMSRTLTKQWPAIKFTASENNLSKRRKLIDVCCDNNFTKAICECCWNLLNKRAPLTPYQKRNLSKHKRLLRLLTDKSVSLKTKRVAVKSGGFAALLPFLIPPVLSALSSIGKK